MNYIYWFVGSFNLIFIIYYFIFIKGSRRNKKIPSEAQYLIYQYKLDISKFSYYRFIRVVGIVTSFDIALVATIVAKVDGTIWQILFGFVAVVPVIIITFMLLGKYYQKKQLLDNSKELEIEKKHNKIKKQKGKKKNG